MGVNSVHSGWGQGTEKGQVGCADLTSSVETRMWCRDRCGSVSRVQARAWGSHGASEVAANTGSSSLPALDPSRLRLPP